MRAAKPGSEPLGLCALNSMRTLLSAWLRMLMVILLLAAAAKDRSNSRGLQNESAHPHPAPPQSPRSKRDRKYSVAVCRADPAR